MFIVENYQLAVMLCFITMLCWGSWGNTQKLAGKTWRYELFYWDYVIGVLLLSLIMAFTLGSIGENGRSFIPDIKQVETGYFLSALAGGAIFNLSNILLSASVSIAGLAVAFPLGVGLALVLGVMINYFNTPKGDPSLLFLGVALVVVAIIVNALAYKRMGNNNEQKSKTKGLLLALVAGILMSTFYRFIAASMDLNNFNSPEIGKMTPYTAMFVFALGMFLSNFIINTIVMRKPFVGSPTTYKDYFSGSPNTHMVGVLGGLIWGLGNLLSLIAAEKAGAAISYGLGQGATLVAAFWGVFIWKEFKGGGKIVNILISFMFILFLLGLSMIVIAGKN
ncbi:MAG: GRP family sugar transporter [Bacteroidales bacterium]|nr:GRP family sugar transporter [Bacteroidales bacterium]